MTWVPSDERGAQSRDGELLNQMMSNIFETRMTVIIHHPSSIPPQSCNIGTFVYHTKPLLCLSYSVLWVLNGGFWWIKMCPDHSSSLFFCFVLFGLFFF